MKKSTIIKRVIRENNLNELRTARSWTDHIRSLLAGLARKERVGREDAAFVQRPEKSVGKKPRKILPPEAKKTNKKIEFPDDRKDKKEQKSLNESYDSFNIEKPAGYGTFMTAQDMGIKIQSAFEHHPTVIKELYRRKTKTKNKKAT